MDVESRASRDNHSSIASDMMHLNSTLTEGNFVLNSESGTDSIINRLRQSFSEDGSRVSENLNVTNENVQEPTPGCFHVTNTSNDTSLSRLPNFDNSLDADNPDRSFINEEERIPQNIGIAPTSLDDLDYFDNSSDEEEDFHDLSNNEEGNVDRRFTKLLEMMQDEEFNECLGIPIGVSKLEMMLAIMKFCKKYVIPNAGVVDLFKMQNMFLNKKVFPENPYQVDQLFNTEEGREYHAVCPKCKVYLGTFGKGQRMIFCEQCDENINLKDPSYTDYFVMFDVESEIQNLIEENEDYYIDIVSRRNKEPNACFGDICDGQKYKKFVASLPADRKESYCTVTFNSDGSPTFKSSKYSIWPIQVVVNEIPLNIRSKKAITCALWFGRNKPNMTYFLRPFVDRMNQLSENGIQYQLQNATRRLYVYALCCCVDSVARAPMQGIVQFNGYYGCNWCLHPGVRIRHNSGYSIKYPLLDENPEKRTAEATFDLMQRLLEHNSPVFGIKNVTPLWLLDGFDVIDGFVPCILHCIDKGLGNQFNNYWMGSSNESYTIPKNKLKIIDQYMKNFKVPTHLIRLSRSVSDRAFWNAVEWSNWILFYSIPILKSISQEFPEFEKYMNHWSLLVEAYHILLQTEITVMELQRASFLLKRFVSDVEDLYTADAMTYNVHQLLHIPQSVADWGPLYAHSGYVFESGNGKIKRNIHAANGVLSQVGRYLSCEESTRLLQKHVEMIEDSPCLEYIHYLENNVTEKSVAFAFRYFGRTVPNKDVLRKFELPVEKVRAYKKIVKDGCPFKSCEKLLYRSDNSFASLKNGDFIEIQQFLVNMEDGKEYTAYKKVIVIDGDYRISNELTYIKQVLEINQNIEITHTRNIDKTCVYLSIDCNNYISSVPNMYYWK